MTEPPKPKVWDVIVIGTGMGGGTIGRRLAENGKSVLFLEKGPAGPRAEQQGLNSEIWDPVARQVRGYWPAPMSATVDGIPSEFFPPLGAGVGGSSVFYAATLERPEPHDLDNSLERPHPTGGWPISFDEMLPYYAQAEALFHVCGEPDPLSPTPQSPLAKGPDVPNIDKAIMAQMRQAGLHPYQSHQALRYVEGCKKCFGFKCPKSCKMDGRSAGVEPALATGHATLLDNCTVTRLTGSTDQITHVVAKKEGQSINFHAKAFVLAAGALSSPRLLLASTSTDWTDGCANSSDTVGRNLMFHLNEMFALWPSRANRTPADMTEGGKAVACRDLYFSQGRRQGIIQAMGVDAKYGEIVYYLNTAFDRSVLKHLRVLRQFTRIPALIATKLFGRAKIFVGLLEDLPYLENRVTLDPEDPEKICVTYNFHPELLARRMLFRREIRCRLKKMRLVFLSRSPDLNFGHPCGTLRFGNDKKSSVLDKNCRAHDVKNLYVVDSSFMPTSFGVNPSLTIAANALRVADHLTSELDKTTGDCL